MSEKKRAIVGHTIRYATSQYFSQFIGFFTAVITRRLLNPFLMGIIEILDVVQGYASYAHLGTAHTLFYKFPYLKGKEKEEEADELKNIIFTFITIAATATSISIMIFAFVFRHKFSPQIFYGLISVSIITICQRVYTYYIMLLRANKDFKILSMSVAFDAVVNLILVLIIVGKFRLYGMYAVLIILPVANTFFIRMFVSYNISYRFDIKKILSCIRFGFPVLLKGILDTLLFSIDRIMIAGMLGIGQLGFYSIAPMARNYSGGISKNFVIVVTPYFLETFGKEEGTKDVSRYIIIPSTILSVFMAFFLSLVFLAAPVFITLVLPKFIPGLTALKIFLLTTFFTTLVPFATDFLIASNRQVKVTVLALVVLAINAALNYVFIKSGYGINGVAAATAIASFFYFIIIIGHAMRHFDSTRDVTWFIIKMLLPLFYAVVLIVLLQNIVSVANTFVDLFLKMTIFSVFYFPFFLYLNKKTKAIDIIISVLKGKTGRGNER